jgi:small subunit ribosomal protein S3
MGQKIHPLGFRLHTTQTHRSLWFQKPKQYSSILQEDFLIRNYLQEKLKDAGISRIQLIRGTDRIIVEIHAGQPQRITGENGMQFKELIESCQLMIQQFRTREAFGAGGHSFSQPASSSALAKRDLIDEARDTLESQELTGREALPAGKGTTQPAALRVAPLVSLQIVQIPQPATDARLIARKVAEQLEKRVAFRRVMKQSVQAAREVGIDGIKIQIAGRLNGAEIARTEWIREGRVPLHTLKADIDYCALGAQTIYGTLGIKVWVFKK